MIERYKVKKGRVKVYYSLNVLKIKMKKSLYFFKNAFNRGLQLLISIN